MKFQLVLALVAAGSLYAAQSIETLYTRGNQAFSGRTTVRAARSQQPNTPLQQRDPQAGPIVEPAQVRGTQEGIILAQPVGKVLLSTILDKLPVLMTLKLGAKDWYVGSAADPANNGFFITFMSMAKDKIITEPISYDRLKGSGQIVELDAQTKYRVRLSPNLFDPVRGSTIYLEPITGGPSYKFKTGVVLDLVKKNSYVFKAKGIEYWLMYGTDIDSQNKKFKDTRSFGFVHENGMNTKVWTLAEAKVPENQTVSVALGDAVIRLFRNAAAELQIFE